MGTSLVGRDDALAEARDRLHREGFAMVAGASGIGKTALVDALADGWRADGRTVVELRGTIGLQPIDLAALTPLIATDATWGSSTELAAAIADGLRRLPDATLLVVDDAHLLDDASAGLLASWLPARGISAALTMTSGEPAPPDLVDLRTRLAGCVVELGPLGLDDVATLATLTLGDDLPDPDLERLHRITLGYPLYVTALLGEAAAGSPWSTDRLAALLERRLARLDRPHRELFDVIAVAEQLPADMAARIDGPALDRLVQADLARMTADRVVPAHPLLASVATATLTHDGRRRCAEVLLAHTTGCDAGDLARVARAALAVGVVPTGGLATEAAEAAIAVGDYDTALAIADGDTDDPRLIAVRAEALRFRGEVPEAPPGGLDGAALTEYLSQRAQALAFVEQRYGAAIAVLADGLARVDAPVHRTRLGLEMMTLAGLAGDLEGVVHAARAVDDTADDETRLLAAATRLFGEGLTLSLRDPDDTYEQARALVAGGVGDALLADRLEMSRALVDLAEGRIVDARHRFTGESLALGPWLTIESLLADAWLPLADAEALAVEAVAALEAFDPLGNLAQARALLALRRAQRGLEDAPDAVPGDDPGVRAIQAVMADRAAAWVDRSAGALADVGRRSVAMGHRLWGLCCFIDAVRLGGGAEVAADIEQLAVARGVGLARLAAGHARATTVDDRWAAAAAWWRAGAPTYAAEAALAGVGPPWTEAGLQLLAARGASPLVGAWPSTGPWTDRQVDVVLRVLAGAGNREVADDLFLSQRTVENHLHAAYARAELGGRDDLVARFGWLGDDKAER